MSAAVALANISGVLAVDGPQRSRYFVYTSEPHLYLASLLALANAAMPLIGFDFILHTPLGRAIGASLPTVRASFSIRTLIAACTVSSAMAIGVSLIAPAMFTETFKSLLLQAPCISIFLLSYTGTQLDKPALRRLAMLIVLVESGRAFLYSYLRSPVAYPFFAYGMGSLFASGSLRIFARKDFLPIYAGSVAYILIYGTLGATRENAPSGWAKIEYMKEYDSALSEEDRSAQQTFVSRMSNFNQLSQIGRVVEEDGCYHGGTLGYLTYAFIPRVLWPEKPLIQRGSWFAVRIGQARPTPEGWYSNTINMTQAGELYLNFGVIGTLAGLPLYGMFFGTLWIAAASHIRLNFLGLAFAYYLIWSNLGQNGDLTVVVSTVAIYLVLLATSSAVRSLSEVAKRRHAATMPHLISAWSTAGAKNGSRSMGVAPHPEGHTSKDSELMQPPSFV